MEILNFSERQFQKLEKYKLAKEVENTEAKLYVYDFKDKWNHSQEFIKIFFRQEGPYFSNKLNTLSELINAKDKINIPEIVMPNKLITIDNQLCGYSQPLIKNNCNIKVMLNNPQVSLEMKLDILYKIAKLINKIAKSPECQDYQFYLGDLHEGNFIYSFSENSIKAIDIDSAKIGNNMSSDSKYLTYNDKLWDFSSKYPLDSNDRHISSYNTMVISFVYMVLSYFGGENFSNCKVSYFYKYLNYLLDCGLPKSVTDMFAQIYLPQDNYLKPELLKEIDVKTLRKIQEKNLYEAIK